MNDMGPDAASFLADMPALEDEPAAELVQPPVMEAAAPDQAAEDMIPDATAFLMDGFVTAGDDAGDAGNGSLAEPLPDSSAQVGLLPPSLALDASRVDLREGLSGVWGIDHRQTLAAKLGFHVGDLRFVVSFDDASELSEMISVYRLPNVPSWFRGLANLHGNLVPVFDVAAMIGSGVRAEAGAKEDRMLLVLGHGAMAAGMLVNELPTRIRLESATAIDLPELPGELKDCVPKAYLHEDEVWLELQYQRFFEMTAARLAS